MCTRKFCFIFESGKFVFSQFSWYQKGSRKLGINIEWDKTLSILQAKFTQGDNFTVYSLPFLLDIFDCEVRCLIHVRYFKLFVYCKPTFIHL
jgi:hypothetical protein